MVLALMPSRWKAVARMSLGLMGVSSTSPPSRVVWPTTLPRDSSNVADCTRRIDCGNNSSSHWTSILLAMQPQGETPSNLTASLDPRILLFTFGVSLLTGVLFGVAPALVALNAPDGTGSGNHAATVNSADNVVADMRKPNDFVLKGYEKFEHGWYVGPGINNMGNDPRFSNSPTWSIV